MPQDTWKAGSTFTREATLIQLMACCSILAGTCETLVNFKFCQVFIPLLHKKCSSKFQQKGSISVQNSFLLHTLDKNISYEYRCIPIYSSDFFTLKNWDSSFPVVPWFCLIWTFPAIFLSFVLLKISRRTGLASWWLAYGWSCDEKG